MRSTGLLLILSAIIDAEANEYIPAGPFDGWNILQQDYLNAEKSSQILDGISLEWEYFMAHDDSFTGIIGYVLADPREYLGGDNSIVRLMPTGLNLAFVGMWADGTKVSNFVNFPPSQVLTLGNGIDVMVTEAKSDDWWCKITPVNESGFDCSNSLKDCSKLRLEGRTEGAEFNLTVEKDWVDREPFSAQRSKHFDIGALPLEHWTVNMIWPRTKLLGSIKNRENNRTISIEKCHGYRENSWGRWTFVTDGWDFAVLSDEDSKVQWNWQSYHNSKSLDFLDVSFLDEGELKSEKFLGSDGQLGWSHSDWSWNDEAYQCAPNNVLVESANKDYNVRAEISIGDNQVAMLSDVTIITKIYVIMEWFPTIKGEIRRQHDNSLVTTFEGQAGGEISFLRSPFKLSDSQCTRFFSKRFKETLTYKGPDNCDMPPEQWWQSLKTRYDDYLSSIIPYFS